MYPTEQLDLQKQFERIIRLPEKFLFTTYVHWPRCPTETTKACPWGERGFVVRQERICTRYHSVCIAYIFLTRTR